MDIYYHLNEFFDYLNEHTDESKRLTPQELGNFKRTNTYKNYIKDFIGTELLISNINSILTDVIGFYDEEQCNDSLNLFFNNIRQDKFHFIDDNLLSYLDKNPLYCKTNGTTNDIKINYLLKTIDNKLENKFIATLNKVKEMISPLIENTNESLNLTNEAKTNHINELKSIMDKLERRRITYNNLKSYNDNMIVPKIYDSIKLPPPLFKEDKIYTQKYQECLKKIRNDYLKFNINYLEENIEDLTTSFNEKKNLISRFNNNINEETTQFDNHLKLKYKNKIENAAEKVKRISEKMNNYNNNENNINNYSNNNNNNNNNKYNYNYNKHHTRKQNYLNSSYFQKFKSNNNKIYYNQYNNKNYTNNKKYRNQNQKFVNNNITRQNSYFNNKKSFHQLNNGNNYRNNKRFNNRKIINPNNNNSYNSTYNNNNNIHNNAFHNQNYNNNNNFNQRKNWNGITSRFKRKN